MLDTYRLLKLNEVVSLTQISKSKIYRDMKTGEFPAPINIGSNCVRWVETDIYQWVESLRSVW